MFVVTSNLVSVTTTNSAALALKYFEAWNGLYDIVMDDFHIADMNIYEFIQWSMLEGHSHHLVHVAGQNGHFQMGGGQVTPKTVYLQTGVLHIPNLIPDQEASCDLGGGIYFDGNTGNVGNIRTGNDQVAAVGNQIFLGGEQVISENGYTTGALQVSKSGLHINSTGQCTALLVLIIQLKMS
ncbi:hypothetical protein ACET3Z_001828 [Daucus carota]